VDHGQVLDVGPPPDRERRVVAPDDAAEPDPDVLAQRDVAGDDRIPGAERAALEALEEALLRMVGHAC
jgi:hypothetical protein